MEWNRLDRQQSEDILEHIAMASDPSLFTLSSSEASFKPLPFYQDFMLYRMTNYAALPAFSLVFLSDGESFFLLDGSPAPIKLVNKKGVLSMNEGNVVDYLDFYLTNIQGEDGDIYLIRDLENLPFIDSLERDQKMELEHRHIEPQVTKDSETGRFIILCDLFYTGTLLKSAVFIDSEGNIEIQPREMIMGHSGAEKGH